MKRVASFFKWAFFAVFLLPAISKTMLGQQGAKPVLTEVRTQNPYPLDPTLPWISEYKQPFIYQAWWFEIAACQHLPLDQVKAARVQFFQVNAPDFIPKDVDAIVLAITYDIGQVYVANPLIWNKALVQHEQTHLLLKWAGDPNWFRHDPRRFTACGLMIGGPPPPNQ